MRLIRIIALGTLGLAGAQSAYGKTLSEVLRELTTFTGVSLPVVVTAPIIAQGTTIERNAVRSADFVAAATTPGFTYEYDPEMGAFERSTSSRGPVLVESPRTLTKGHLDLGLSYFYSHLTELDGNELTDAFNGVVSSPESTFVTQIDTFDLHSQAVSLYATYGIRADLDLNLLVPIFLTEIRLHGRQTLAISEGVATAVVDEDESKFGIGDIIVRAKQRLPDAASIESAALLGLRLPAGNEDNFHGLGDVVLTPLFAAGRSFGPHEMHANLGIDVNADDLERSRVRYALGASIEALPFLSLLVDVIGSSGVADDDFFVGNDFTGTVERTDMLDLATGVKLSMGDRFVANVGTIVPLTDDGLRADVIPTAGFELTF